MKWQSEYGHRKLLKTRTLKMKWQSGYGLAIHQECFQLCKANTDHPTFSNLKERGRRNNSFQTAQNAFYEEKHGQFETRTEREKYLQDISLYRTPGSNCTVSREPAIQIQKTTRRRHQWHSLVDAAARTSASHHPWCRYQD